MGNYKDSKLETMAQWGQGNFIYLDNASEAERVFNHEEFRKILVTFVRNACIKTIFNPDRIRSYRLIGYESRTYGKNDSLASKLPGGEIGYGQHITAFYELEPVQPVHQALVYPDKSVTRDSPDKLATIVLQYQTVSDGKDHLLMKQVSAKAINFQQADYHLQYAAAVTLFGMLLQHSDYSGDGTYDTVEKLIKRIKDKASKEDRKAFLKLVQKAARLEETVLNYKAE